MLNLINTNKPHISIVLCTYNEEAAIKNTIEQIFKHNSNCEIVLVDDNSTDDTVKIANQFTDERIQIIERKKRGLASAAFTGLIFAKSDILCWIDSNLPDLASKIPIIIKNLSEDSIVVMSRYVKGGDDKRSKKRILTSKLINLVCRVILGNEIKDYTSGIFVMNKTIFKKILPIPYGHGEYFIEFLYQAKKNGCKIIELPYEQPADLEGMSKTASSLLRFLRVGINYFIRIFISLLNRQ